MKNKQRDKNKKKKKKKKVKKIKKGHKFQLNSQISQVIFNIILIFLYKSLVVKNQKDSSRKAGAKQ